MLIEDNCLWYLNSHLIRGKAKVLEFCPKSPMLDFMVNHSYFFIFVTWISLIIIGILRDIHKNVGRKNWNFGGTHEMPKKKNWNRLVPRLGSRLGGSTA